MYRQPGVVKSDIISRFVDEVGITPSSADSYYYVFIADGGNHTPRINSIQHKAQCIFNEMSDSDERSIIKCFIQELGLTPEYAGTCFTRLAKPNFVPKGQFKYQKAKQIFDQMYEHCSKQDIIYEFEKAGLAHTTAKGLLNKLIREHRN
jgi:hypothetical protein